MRTLVLFNPIAGAGRAAHAALEIGAALHAGGVEAQLSPTRRESAGAWLTPLLDGMDLLVVVGGDGAVRLAAGPASAAATPLYQVPLGTENLFARQFGMDARPQTLLAALRRMEILAVDLGRANEHDFLSMVSIGYDAEIVADLAGRRRGAITHMSYVPPMLRQLRRWRPQVLAVSVDGRTLNDDEAGCVVVANSRQYAFRMDPCAEASMTDGLLDVMYLPVRSRLDMIRWMIKCRSGSQMSDRRARFLRGREVEITCQTPQRFQIDGDAPLSADGAGQAAPVTSLRISVRPGALRVLVPGKKEVRDQRSEVSGHL